MNAPALKPFDYAPAPPQLKRRIVRVSLLIVVIVGGGLLWHWHTPLIAHTRLMRWQRSCAKCSYPADAVLASSEGPAKTVAAPIPSFWTSYEAQCITTTLVRGWVGLPAARFSKTLLFLHERRSPAGHARIVGVRCSLTYLTSASVTQSLEPIIVEPASWRSLSSRPVIHADRSPGGYPVSADVRVFGGQPDPADASHFTIAYTVEGRPGLVDGWLTDTDTLKLTVRSGSAEVNDRFRTKAN
jgi:hypothetical protein